VPGVLAISQDITEHKERGRALTEAQEQLRRQASNLNLDERQAAQAASRAKSAFLAHMSHELRSPLNAILGFAEVIRSLHFGQEQIEKYAEYSGYIHQAGTHLLALIDDILDIAKVEAGKMDLQPSSFDLTELLDECARMMRPMVDGRGLALRVNGSAAGLSLTADRRRTQMIINLPSNAIKFTMPAGWSWPRSGWQMGRSRSPWPIPASACRTIRSRWRWNRSAASRAQASRIPPAPA
jgi:signal transduction histidine kinase